MSQSVRVVSYNVLSSHLGSPSYFTACQPCHLEASNRLPKIFSKLEKELASSSKTPVVFCLQEISQDWAGDFHKFFVNRGYHMVTGLYGKKFNGYMGVALAYPTNVYETVDVDICRLSDKRVEGWPRAPLEEDSGLLQKANKLRKSVSANISHYLIGPAKKLLRGSADKKVIDHWKMSQNRFNILLSVGLRERCDPASDSQSDEKKTFWISNYHMPCAFFAPMVMNIHSELAARHLQNLASKTTKHEDGSTEVEKQHPYILAGDFNILPESPHYRLLTEGKLDRSDVTYPSPKYGMEWDSDKISPFRSAYAVANDGIESDFTNYAKVKDDEPFIGTLDYIFLSPEWKVKGVKSLEHRSKIVNPPFPNEEEPSDHYLIAADLELEN